MNQYLKRTVAGISALMLAALPGMTAFAADTAGEFREAQMPVLLYAPDQVSSIDCRFYGDLPSIPYVKLSDYYSLWAGKELKIKDLGDGAYSVEVPYGTKGVFDTEKDQISAEDRFSFFAPEENYTGENYMTKLFINFQKNEDADEEEISKEVTLDLASYEIDLRSGDGDVWCPLPTLCDLFYDATRNGNYLEDTLMFGKDLSSDFPVYLMTTAPQYADELVEKYQNGRPADLAKYNYNELCLTFDFYYGFPGRLAYTDLLREKGLDGMLSELNDTTRALKEMLLSTDYAEYVAGYDCVNMYLWDGGHTVFSPVAENNKDFLNQVVAVSQEKALSYEDNAGLIEDQTSTYYSVEGVTAARAAMVEDADTAETFAKGIEYYEKGDTAVFYFDQFMISGDAWDAYYNGDGELPEDLLTWFYKCVLRADQNPEIKNFVLDLGTNTGGLTLIAQYMMGIMTDLTATKAANNIVGIVSDSRYKVDKNFDKAFDALDDEFKTDLRFGIITSHRSFSCGNWLPSLAKDNGIMLMGEASGGGSCFVEVHISPDGMLYTLSIGNCLVGADGSNIDNGITPHYETVKYLEDGQKDFSETYNFANISKRFDEFYGTEPIVTTTTAESTTTTTVTTTTTADTAPETTAQTSETTSTETTTVTEKQYFAPVSELGDMAAKDYESKKGKAPAKTVTTENEDGTVTVSLQDEAGKVLDTYTIDPVTGTGKDSKGGEVNLPQTGNNVLSGVAALAGALVLMGAGAAAVAGSGVFRKKDSE